MREAEPTQQAGREAEPTQQAGREAEPTRQAGREAEAEAGIRYGPVQLARLLGLPEPTPEQAAVISAPVQPLAVIAGAGSGKSETMAARLVWLVANGMVRPERVLGLTFPRKAAAELGQRLPRLSLCLGVDQVGDAFGLVEGKLTRLECAAGELARRGEA